MDKIDNIVLTSINPIQDRISNRILIDSETTEKYANCKHQCLIRTVQHFKSDSMETYVYRCIHCKSYGKYAMDL